MHTLMATLVAVAMLVQAQTPSKRFPDVQMDGFKGAVKTVRTAIESSGSGSSHSGFTPRASPQANPETDVRLASFRGHERI